MLPADERAVNTARRASTDAYVPLFQLMPQVAYCSSRIAAIATRGLLPQTQQRGRSVCVSVCLSVGHVREPCTNGGNDRHADWRIDLGGPKEPRQRANGIWVQTANFYLNKLIK